MPIQDFPPSVIEKLEFYVYLLIDPETKQVFYVGKGNGNRIFAHANAALANPVPGEKLDRIREIHAKNLDVDYIIIRHGLSKEAAFEVEAALIDYIGLESLTNQVIGFSSDERGQMTVADIIEKYAAPEVTISEDALLITVNRLYRKGMTTDQIYEITRGNWVIGARREKARYAFAVYNGIIRGVFTIEKWERDSTRDANQKNSNRWKFTGKPAVELQHYIGGSTVRYPASQNPIRYVNC